VITEPGFSRRSTGPNSRVALESIAGFEFSTLSLVETIGVMHAWLAVEEPGTARMFVCGNPHSLEVARRDAPFAAALRGADLMIPDGVGIVVASKFLHGRIRETVCGPDVFVRLSRDMNDRLPGKRVFFLGGMQATIDALTAKFSLDFPNLVIAGAYSPPFRSEFTAGEDKELVSRVNAARPDLLWIGLGAPKQEKWAFRNRYRLSVRVIGPVGAVFDFYTGRVKLPPVFVQRLGLIWLFRFFQQPRRLWNRQVNGVKFLCRVVLGRKN